MLRKNDVSPIDNHADPACAAEAADLSYVTDDTPGILRRKFGKGFAYYKPDGTKASDAKTLGRINALAIPPAYVDVWICPDPRGHLQATGRDDRGSKQYRYHERWGEVRDAAKFARLIEFAAALPRLRRTVRRHLKLPGLPREKVLAACVKLLDLTFIRVGNDEYTRTNSSFGLTTLRDEHAEFARGGILRLEFTGKHGLDRELEVRDSRLAKIVRACQDLPGQELLQYVDEAGAVRDIGSGDVNAYLAEIAGEGLTAKDFRTWHATVLAAAELRGVEPAASKTARNRQIVAAIDDVAEQLGNTRSVCRKCYVHPGVIAAFESATLAKQMSDPPTVRDLSRDESATLEVIRHSAARDCGKK